MTGERDVPAFVGWTIPEGWTPDNIGHCRSCGAEVLWCLTAARRKAPVDQAGTSHFASCPQASTWRRREPVRVRRAKEPAVTADPVNVEAISPFEACPVCGSASVMRLVEGWHDGRPIAIVGCGNPWHYDRPGTVSLGDSDPLPSRYGGLDPDPLIARAQDGDR